MKNVLLLMVLLPTVSFAQANGQWRITKSQWTAQDEARFGEFIAQIGDAVERRECAQVDTCLRSSANPYVGTDPSGLRHYADCADLPYYLRSYFAWKNGLPMSVQSDVSPREAGDNRDARYTKFGNYVTDRFDIVASRWKTPNAIELLNETIINSTYSASFRMMGGEDKGLYTDFYPVKLGRESIRAGTVIYDPNGHVAVIYKVSEDGRIFYIDSHPDNTLTSGMYTPKFVRSNPYQGAGFKNFRPLNLVGAKLNSSGNYIGGRIVGARNNSLADFSLEQFYGNQPDPAGDWQKGKFIYRGVTFLYYDYLRIVMSDGDLKINPLRDMQLTVADICTSLKDRVVAVNVGYRAGVDKKTHPERLPMNIFGADGEWEMYATPSRDARLKVAFMDLLSQSHQHILRYRAGDSSINYSGANLAADLLATYQRASRSCQFSYTTSSGRAVALDLESARNRLFDLSFDPYHCVELRWGARSLQELSSCQDDANKREWFSRERWLRYQWERRYDARMDYSLDELTGPKPGAGLATPPNVDIISYLNSQI